MDDNNCNCARCKNPDVDIYMPEQMEKHGWIAHLITNANNYYKFDIHTHGLKENYKHYDIQIVLSMPIEVAHNIVHSVIDDIKNGKVFAENEIFRGYLGNNMPLTFCKVVEADRKVLRLIFPDKDGNLFYDDMTDPVFKNQWTTAVA